MTQKQIFPQSHQSQETTIETFRGGRLLSRQQFFPNELRQCLGDRLEQDGATRGLSEYDIFISQAESENEIAANLSSTLEDTLRAASTDGTIQGKTFIIDLDVVHKGAAITFYQAYITG